VAELHHRKPVLETEWAITVDLTNAWARARDIVAAINHEGTQCPTFARASQNMAATAALLDTLPTPSPDAVEKVYRQLKDMLNIATA
jgi:hypothetical protein